MDDIIDPRERLDKLLSGAVPYLAHIFREAVEGLKDNLDLNALADLIESGRMDQALDMLQEVSTALGNSAAVIFVTAGQSTASFLEGATIGHVVFNVVNQRAVEIMQANRLRLIQEFTYDQRQTVRAALTEGIRRGDNPRAQARTFRDVVGLTETQSRAVFNYRRLVEGAGNSDLPTADQAESLTRALRDGRTDRSVLRAIKEGRPLSPEQVDMMVQRYAKAYVKYRSEVIARSEALAVVHQGTEEMYNQAIEAGKLHPEQLIRTWSTNIDGRERDSHHNLDGVKRGWGQTWPGRDGPIRYPGDPEAPASERVQCRCLLTTRIKPTKG